MKTLTNYRKAQCCYYCRLRVHGKMKFLDGFTHTVRWKCAFTDKSIHPQGICDEFKWKKEINNEN